MDVLEHLIEEHRETERLLAELERSQTGPRREELVDQLVDALTMHMEVEEQFLYPLIGEVLGDEQLTGAENEHRLTREGLELLGDLVDERGFEAAVAMVAAGTKHHVDDEESDVFPQLRERAADRLGALDPEELERQVRSGDGRPPDEPTKEELYEQAREAGIEGRSAMTKEELSRALSDQDR